MNQRSSSKLVTVLAILGLGILAMTIPQPILPLYLTSIGITPATLGLILSAAMAGMVIGETSWGWVADKVGLKLPLSIGTFACSLMVFCFILTRNIPTIFLIFFFWGITRSAIFGPCRGYIGANTPPQKRATFMAFITVVIAVSRGLGALPSGFIVDTWGYRWIFLISCGISLLGGAAVVAGLMKAKMIKQELPATSLPAATSLSISHRMNIIRLLVCQGIVASLQWTAAGILTAFLPLLATQVVGVQATEVGIIFSITGLVTVMLGIPMGMLADRHGKKLFMINGLLLSASGMAGLAFAESYSWLIGFSILNSIGMTMFTTAALGLLSSSVPPRQQSTVMGLYGGLFEDSGVIAGSVIGGFAWSAWGPQNTFLIGTIACCVGATICLGFVKEQFPQFQRGLT
jgi:PPP family 3-phenylpropionic acid transporter